MGIQKVIENPNLVYLSYTREAWDDVKKLGQELLNATAAASADIVLEFKTNNCVSAEIGAIVGCLNRIKNSMRALRLIMPPAVRKQIEHTNLEKIGNIAFYDNRNDLIKAIGGGQSPAE